MDISSLMGQFGQIQDTLKTKLAERASERIEGSAGGGAVRVTLRGDLSVDQVQIAPAAAAAVGDDPGMLEDLIAAAMNDALRAYGNRYGKTPDEQLQKALAGSDLGALLGPLLGGLG